MKRVTATTIFFAFLSLVFFGAIYCLLQWNNHASASVSAPGGAMGNGPALQFHSAMTAMVGAFLLTIPFFYGGPPAVLDLLKRCIVSLLVLGFSFAVLFIEIAAFAIVIGAFIHIEASPSTLTELDGDWKSIEGLVGETMNPPITISAVGAFLGAAVFAVACLSDWLSAILLVLKRSITTFLFFGYAFVFLFVPIFYVATTLVGTVVGGSADASIAPEHMQQLGEILKDLPDTIRKFIADHGIWVMLASALVAASVSFFFSASISFSDQLPWCRTPKRVSKKP